MSVDALVKPAGSNSSSKSETLPAHGARQKQGTCRRFSLPTVLTEVEYISSRQQQKKAACTNNMQAHRVQASANNAGVSLSSVLQKSNLLWRNGETYKHLATQAST